jgi:hypothetical protein
MDLKFFAARRARHTIQIAASSRAGAPARADLDGARIVSVANSVRIAIDFDF